jgi:hypothetical protein
MKKIFSAIAMMLCGISFSQKNVFIEILPIVGSTPLQIGANHVDASGTAFKLDHFDYYLSNLHVIHDGGQDLDLSDTIFLVEPSNYVLYLGFLNVQNIEQINFGIGVPEAINTSSSPAAVDISTWPSNHPLSFQDPSMYWGWLSGYMHMIIGGWADANGDGTAENTENYFELHNLGNNNYASVSLPVIQSNSYPDQIDIDVNCHVDAWVNAVNLVTCGIKHGTNGLNSLVMGNVLTQTVFDQSPNAGVNTPVPSVGNIYYSSDAWSLQLFWKDMVNATKGELIDASGRIVKSFVPEHSAGSTTISELESGVYLFNMYAANKMLIRSIKIVQQ